MSTRNISWGVKAASS